MPAFKFEFELNLLIFTMEPQFSHMNAIWFALCFPKTWANYIAYLHFFFHVTAMELKHLVSMRFVSTVKKKKKNIELKRREDETMAPSFIFLYLNQTMWHGVPFQIKFQLFLGLLPDNFQNGRKFWRIPTFIDYSNRFIYSFFFFFLIVAQVYSIQQIFRLCRFGFVHKVTWCSYTIPNGVDHFC